MKGDLIMKEKSVNPEELMQKLNNNQLSDGELEKINGGGLYIAVDPSKCPYHLSKYVIYATDLYTTSVCLECKHNTGRSFGCAVRSCCEFAYSGNVEWKF
jgi:hypothetical protein